MITLQDFLDKGYVVEIENDYPSERRSLLPYEDDYPKILELAKSIGTSEKGFWGKIKDAIEDSFSNKYHLFSIGSCGDEVTSIDVYFNDVNAQGFLVTKGASKISLIVERGTRKVYSVRDICNYFQSYSSNQAIDIYRDYQTVDSVLMSIKKDREKNRRNVLTYYNQLLKKTKSNYKRSLEIAKGYIKDI